MTKPEITYLEETISKQMRDLWSRSSDLITEEAFNSYNDKPDPVAEEQWDWIYEELKQLYHRILTYLEAKELPQLATIFKSKTEIKLSSQKTALNTAVLGSSDPYLTILDDFQTFLSCFQAFDTSHTGDRKFEILENILSNTAGVLKHNRITFKNEADIYREMKWFIDIAYPSSRSLNKARFIKKFTTYRPDILIPEIETAIEYKLIQTGDNVETYIDQLKTDADNYTRDPDYSIFYAVIYVADKSIASKKSIEHSWAEKEFPKNWKLIIDG